MSKAEKSAIRNQATTGNATGLLVQLLLTAAPNPTLELEHRQVLNLKVLALQEIWGNSYLRLGLIPAKGMKTGWGNSTLRRGLIPTKGIDGDGVYPQNHCAGRDLPNPAIRLALNPCQEQDGQGPFAENACAARVLANSSLMRR